MAGYSGTPLPKKLDITGEQLVASPGAPERFMQTLGDLPAAGEIPRRARGPLDVIVLFTRRRSELERRFEILKRGLRPNGGLWIAWSKRTSGVRTDLTEDLIRQVGLGAGLVDNKVCAIDETWSGLRFVYRLADR